MQLHWQISKNTLGTLFIFYTYLLWKALYVITVDRTSLLHLRKYTQLTYNTCRTWVDSILNNFNKIWMHFFYQPFSLSIVLHNFLFLLEFLGVQYVYSILRYSLNGLQFNHGLLYRIVAHDQSYNSVFSDSFVSDQKPK